jgi:hypothetical protein
MLHELKVSYSVLDFDGQKLNVPSYFIFGAVVF